MSSQLRSGRLLVTCTITALLTASAGCTGDSAQHPMNTPRVSPLSSSDATSAHKATDGSGTVNQSAPEERHPTLQIDREAYVAKFASEAEAGGFTQYTFNLAATIRNHADRAIHLQLCRPSDTVPIYSVTMADRSDGESGYSPLGSCVGHTSSIVVAAGEERTDEFTLEGPNSFDSKTGRSTQVVSGRMQFVYPFAYCSPRDCPAAADFLSSNIFTVTIAR